MSQKTTSRKVDADAFVAWCERQAEQSRSPTARIVADTDEMVRFRLREEGVPEDIVLLKGNEADVLRFVRGDDTRQFRSHRRQITFHDKTLIVRTIEGEEICRAGTGTRNKRGPFPV